MLLLAFMTVLAGFLLGTKFKFFVLVPAVVSTTFAILTAGVVHAESIDSVALPIVIACVCLQVGYLMGFIVYSALITSGTTSLRKDVVPAISEHTSLR
jgi:hypothetical protein